MDTAQVLQQAAALATSGKKAEARRLLVETLKTDPREPDLLWALAMLTADEPERRKILKRLLQIQPDHAKAQAALNRTAMGHGDSQLSPVNRLGYMLVGVLIFLVVVGGALLLPRLRSLQNAPALPPLTETYTAPNGTFSFKYPAGWVIEAPGGEGYLTIANSQQALDIRRNSRATYTPDDVVFVLTSRAYDIFKDNEGKSLTNPTEVAAQFIIDNTALIPIDDPNWSMPTATWMSIDGRGAAIGQAATISLDYVMVAIDQGDGYCGMVVAETEYGAFSRWQPLAIAMAASLQRLG